MLNRTIYENLASAGTPHQEALCNSSIDEIDPNIRFCAYRLRLGGASGTASGARDAEELVTMLRKKGNVVGIDLLEAQLEVSVSCVVQLLLQVKYRDNVLTSMR